MYTVSRQKSKILNILFAILYLNMDRYWSKALDELKGSFGDKEARKRDLEYKRKILLENGIDASNWTDQEVLIYFRNSL